MNIFHPVKCEVLLFPETPLSFVPWLLTEQSRVYVSSSSKDDLYTKLRPTHRTIGWLNLAIQIS